MSIHDELSDVLLDWVVTNQDEWIRVNFGDDAAVHANYGWGSDWREPLTLVVETKVNGYGVLVTHASLQGRGVDVAHAFQPFGDEADGV